MIKSLVLIILLFFNSGVFANAKDPYESFNRSMFKFNQAFDATVTKPTVHVYNKIVPVFMRKGIYNVFNNLYEIPSAANNLLQGELTKSIQSSWRFFINSTFGIAGLFDVASEFGIKSQYTDFGVTLAKFGNKDSAFLVLPFLGPSTVRDFIGWNVDYYLLSPYPLIPSFELRTTLNASRLFVLRADYTEAENVMSRAIDPYLLQRDAYLQRRAQYWQTKDEQEVKFFEDNYVDEL